MCPQKKFNCKGEEIFLIFFDTFPNKTVSEQQSYFLAGNIEN